MTALDLQQRCQSLSADDGDIERALAALDVDLRGWVAALRTLKDLMDAERLWNAVEPPAPPPPPADSAAPERVGESGATTPDAAPAADGEDPGDTHSADEALLNALDPELARAIRVKRRLTGKRRSVQELIAEAQSGRRAARGKDAPAGQRKAWWRKRDG
ncbi:MAG: hypothetical protein AB1716_17285 [Planctomycetota bacterium]